MKTLHVLQHALGLNEYGAGTAYRNHFVTSPESEDGQICERCVALGLMTIDHRYSGSPLAGGATLYRVTDAGRESVRRNSPKPPRKSAGQKRYEQYLNSCSGESFGEWLRNRKELGAVP
jgi:hypothetical protein